RIWPTSAKFSDRRRSGVTVIHSNPGSGRIRGDASLSLGESLSIIAGRVIPSSTSARSYTLSSTTARSNRFIEKWQQPRLQGGGALGKDGGPLLTLHVPPGSRTLTPTLRHPRARRRAPWGE